MLLYEQQKMSDRTSSDSERPQHDLGQQRLTIDDDITTPQSHNPGRLLYTSHFLSTWNSRAFEFGAFLFLASIYPQTLLPASVYALARAGSAATLSPWIGSYIDRAERLQVVRLSIIGQRVAVALSCALLYVLATIEDSKSNSLKAYGALAVLSILACVEKLAAVMNTISVERDWVVIVAGDDLAALRMMNSQMRRIDLFCKLVAPLFISTIDGVSSSVAILVTGGMTAVSVLVEYLAIERVYSAIPELQRMKQSPSPMQRSGAQQRLSSNITGALADTRAYFTHQAFLPSFALALLYLTVLSFNGQMITYLIATGLSSSLIGILRGISAIFELSATWFAPKLMSRIGPVRSGIWFLNWELGCVTIACASLWLGGAKQSNILTTVCTISAVVASRIGLWGFDLSAQLIVQEEVEAELRGTFSSQEFTFQNIFEMLSFASTIVFARPEQFSIPSTVSAAAVGVASVFYAAFVRRRRGHLVHYSPCMQRNGKASMSRRGWSRVAQEEDGDDIEMADTAGQ